MNAQGVGGISINAKFGSDPIAFKQALKINVATTFHPLGCDTIKSVVDHELGHELDKLLNLRHDPIIKNIYTTSMMGGKMEQELSGYAKKSIAEFIAEAWAEFQNNTNTRAVAKAIGERILYFRKRVS